MFYLNLFTNIFAKDQHLYLKNNNKSRLDKQSFISFTGMVFKYDV